MNTVLSNYAVIVGSQVVNMVVWDGDPSTWQPPEGATVVQITSENISEYPFGDPPVFS